MAEINVSTFFLGKRGVLKNTHNNKILKAFIKVEFKNDNEKISATEWETLEG